MEAFQTGWFWILLIERAVVLCALSLCVFIYLRLGIVDLALSGKMIIGSIVFFEIAAASGSLLAGAAVTLPIVSTLNYVLNTTLHYKFRINTLLFGLLFTLGSVPLGNVWMRPEGGELLTAAPEIVRSYALDLPSAILIFVCLAAISVGLSFAYWNSVLGYKLRVMESPKYQLDRHAGYELPDIRRLGAVMALFSAVLIVAVIILDAYVVQGRFYSGLYDSIGFIAFAVALGAKRSFVLLPVLALAFAVAEAFVRLLNHFVPWVPTAVFMFVIGGFIVWTGWQRAWEFRRD